MMADFLPNATQAIIPKAKIVDYLLSPFHPKGKHKAHFFFSFGFRAGRWQSLAEALTRHAQEHPVIKVESNQHGLRYIIEGPLRSPDERDPRI